MDTFLTFCSQQRLDCISESRLSYTDCIGKGFEGLEEKARLTSYRNYGSYCSDHPTHHITIGVSSGE